MKDNNDNGVVNLSTKVSRDFANIFKRICEMHGSNTYETLQQLAAIYVRFTDDHHNLSYDLQKIIYLFETARRKDNFNLADYRVKKKIIGSIYFLSGEERVGTVPVMVTPGFMGDDEVTSNITSITETVIEQLEPRLYKRLREIGHDLNCNSLFETIFTLCEIHSPDPDEEAIREEFEDARRSEWGRKEPEHVYRRRHHKSPDMFNRNNNDND